MFARRSIGLDSDSSEQPRGFLTRLFFNPAHRISTRLTREGYQFVFLLGFSLVAAIIQNVNLLVLLGGSLAGLLLLQWRLCSRTLYGLRMQRNLPRDIEAGRRFFVELVLSNPRPWLGSWWVIAHEKVIAAKTNRIAKGDSQTLLVNVERVLPRDQSRVRYECLCIHRGEYLFQRSEISTRFPLSLMRGIRSLGQEAKFLVHPMRGKMDPNWRTKLELPRLGLHERRVARSGGDGEFFGLRDYRSGDAMRLIHWRSSAKRNQLLVRQMERQENFEIALLLDLTEPANDNGRTVSSATRSQISEARMEATEIAVELINTLTRTLLVQQNGIVTLNIADGRENWKFRISSVSQLSAVLDRLAIANASPRSNFSSIAEYTFGTIAIGTPTIVVSLRDQSESGVDELRAVSSSMLKLSNIRWVNVSNGEWNSFFQRGTVDEA